MQYFRTVVQVQRGSSSTPITYDEPADAPIINIAPFEHCDIEYFVYYHTFIVPLQGRAEQAQAKAIYIKLTTPPLVAIDLLSSDWRQEGFEEGDEIALYGHPYINQPGTLYGAVYGKINKIIGNRATISIYAQANVTNLRNVFYAHVFLIEPERRGTPSIPPTLFQTQIRRYGDVASDVSPLSGLRYAEPHANAFLTISESHTILPYNLFEIPTTGIPEANSGLDIILPVINFLRTWSDIPPSKRDVSAFRLLQKKMRFANFFSYRSEYNTLARYAQRDLYHEQAELITRVTLNSEEREIVLPLRLRLMHANTFPDGSPAPNVTPTIGQGGGVLISTCPVIPDSFLSASFALTTDNNTHHLSTRIRHQHDLTRFTNANVFFTPTTWFAVLPSSAILSDLRRNPFETYVTAVWRFSFAGREYALCSDAIPVDIDENIQKIVGWQNDASLDYHYHRFNDAVLTWTESGPPERGEYQVYVRIRKDANSPVYTAQQYTFKLDESTLVSQTATYEAYYALHYAHQAAIVPANSFITSNADFQIDIQSPAQYQVFMSVPPPSFDFPLVRNPSIRPKTGALFHWFEALGCPVFNTTSGSLFNAQPIRVADGEMRIYILTPSGKIYATTWRQVRAQEPTNLSFNVHEVFIAETPNFVIINFPNIGSQPTVIKTNVRIFQDSINTLKPIAEAAYDAFTGAKTTDAQKILPLFGFFGARLFLIAKANLPPGRYKLHCIAQYSETVANNAGFRGYADDVDYTFTTGTTISDTTPIPRQECCYTPPVVVAENIPYIVFDDATNRYIQKNITIPSNPSGPAWQDFSSAYECCFKIYNNSAILRENFVDVIAVFDNRLNNIPISGRHWFRYRGFLQPDGYEIAEESYVRSDLSEEPVLRTYRRKYILELFLSDCDIKQLEFQKLARRWIVRNYTNSLLPGSIEVLVKNIEQVAEYNKLKVTVSLIDYKPDEYRHK